MGWLIIKDKKDSSKTTVSFPEEKKEAVFKNGELQYVVVKGIKVKFTDHVHPDQGGLTRKVSGKKEPEIVTGEEARRAISAASDFMNRINKHSVSFNKSTPEYFGPEMLEGAQKRVGVEINDVALEMDERKKKMDVALAKKEAKKKLEKKSPEQIIAEGGDVNDYLAATKEEEKHISEVYGVAPNAKKPDGLVTDEQLQEYKKALDQMYENIGAARARANAMRGVPATRVGGRNS